MSNPFDEVSENDLKIMREIQKKYDLSYREIEEMGIIQIVLMKTGYGRNNSTARMLRAIADMIESPIETVETIEARMKNRLQ